MTGALIKLSTTVALVAAEASGRADLSSGLQYRQLDSKTLYHVSVYDMLYMLHYVLLYVVKT